MRTIPTPLAPLAAALLLAAAAAPAAARSHDLAPADAPAAAATHAVVAEDGVVRPLVRVRLAADAGVRLPAHVVVADSAGTLVASFLLRGEGVVRPMMVVVDGRDLVLKADTPEGQLRLRLHELNDPATEGRISGQWALDAREGALSGRARR